MIDQSEVKKIDIDGQTLAYTQAGSGRPLVLMHGWGCDHTTVASIAATAALSHTVYNVDFPGFGASPEPVTVWSVYDYADLISKFIDRMGLDRPVLVGHSFGGRVAIILGSQRPVDKIVLVDAAGIKPRRSLTYYYKVYTFKAAKLAMKLLYGAEGAQKRIDSMRARRGSSDYASASPRMRAIMSRVVNEDLTRLLPQVKASTLLIWGENDTATPLADAKKMNSLLPDSGLVSFPGCGHYSFLDNPAQFAAVLKSFLNS